MGTDDQPETLARPSEKKLPPPKVSEAELERARAEEGEAAALEVRTEPAERDRDFLSLFGRDSELDQVRRSEQLRRSFAVGAGVAAAAVVLIALLVLLTWPEPWSRAVVLLAAGALAATLLRSVDLLSMPFSTRLRVEQERAKRPLVKGRGDVESLANAVAAVLAATRGQKPED